MKMAAAVVIGFLFGALLMFLARPVQRVHADAPLTLHVREVPKGGDVDMPGGRAVGISCIPANAGTGLQWHCFVATVD